MQLGSLCQQCIVAHRELPDLANRIAVDMHIEQQRLPGCVSLSSQEDQYKGESYRTTPDSNDHIVTTNGR
jgi:hypothetical protein